MVVKPALPPGQVLAKTFPIYSALGTPEIDVSQFKMRIFGAVRKPLEFSWEGLMQQQGIKKTEDFHCVTRWSRVGDVWEGIALKPLLFSAQPFGRFLMFHCYEGYTTNLPIEYIDDNAMLAFGFNGKPLEKIHGGPLRALVPTLYGWKSAKWINDIEVMEQDKPGFWEQRGYNMRGDYTKEERYWEGVGFVDKLRAIGKIL